MAVRIIQNPGETQRRYIPQMRLLSEWNDIFAMTAAREILMGLKYPDDETRRSLYASWLRVMGSNKWHNSLERLMLECVAATPSPTTPGRPLFANIYSVRHPGDGPIPNILAPMMDLDQLPELFSHKLEPIEPLPASAGLGDYLAALIRKSSTSRAALDEAGLIIGFCSLGLAVVATKPGVDVRALFSSRWKATMLALVPTSFDGDIFVPTGDILDELVLKSFTHFNLTKPYLVLLVLGQYAYHANVDACPSADIKFLMEGFLNHTRYTSLRVIELLYAVQRKCGIGAKELNVLIRSHGALRGGEKATLDVAEYLVREEMPMQKTRPWCLAASANKFLYLDLVDHMDYALGLTALLAPDPDHKLWEKPEFIILPLRRVKRAQLWARGFRRLLRKRKNATSVQSAAPEKNG